MAIGDTATRDDALAALTDVLRAPDAKPADRLRAAEALLRAHGEGLAPTGDAYELSDQDLMRLARGEEGGTPPEMGPAVPTAGAVPSHADAEQSPTLPGLRLPAKREEAAGDTSKAKGTQNGPAKSDPPPAGNPFLVRVPKKGHKGTQNEPANLGLAPALFATDPVIGHDPDPWT
jgi:hypothetical protein